MKKSNDVSTAQISEENVTDSECTESQERTKSSKVRHENQQATSSEQINEESVEKTVKKNQDIIFTTHISEKSVIDMESTKAQETIQPTTCKIHHGIHQKRVFNSTTKKHRRKSKTKDMEFLLETLTEAKQTSPHTLPSVASTADELKTLLTEMGESDEAFVVETATEEVSTKDYYEMATFHTKVEAQHNKSETEHKGKATHDKTDVVNVKPVVFILNNTGRKLVKVNETFLEKLLNRTMGKTIDEVNLKYIDLHKFANEERTEQEVTDDNECSTDSANSKESDVTKSLISGDGFKSCSKSDFESSNHCMCDIDNYWKTLKNKLDNVDINKFECDKFISVDEGIVIHNKSEPLHRKKRSLLYLTNTNPNVNVIEANIENIFGKEYEPNQNDFEILALPGTSVKIPCRNNADDLLENKGVKYSWGFRRVAAEVEEPLPGGNNVFPIYKLDIKDAGNYTCTKSKDHGEPEKYVHELEIITLPIYKVKMEIYYSVEDGGCSLSDCDILYSYLPKIFDEFMCGHTAKICSVSVDRPVCVNEEDDSFLNVTVSATMNSITDLITADQVECDIACEMKVYANLVNLTYKNAEVIQKLPVVSKLNQNIYFMNNATDQNITPSPPNLIITCKDGFGVEKTTQRVCVLCPQHTSSEHDEAFCKLCPPGRYQPTPGSKECLVCSSPVDDVMCLRMLYSDTKIFKIYVGVGFGFVCLLILIMCFWKSSANSKQFKRVALYDGVDRNRIFRKRTRDPERSDMKPLLGRKGAATRNELPKIPPPDF